MAQKQVSKTKKGNGAKAVTVMSADMFASDAGVGVDDLGSEDLAIPFIKILQKMSDELEELDDAKAGDIYNTVTKEIAHGKDGIQVINCAYTLQYIEWEPRGSGTGAPHHIYAAGEELPDTKRGEDNKDYVTDGEGRYLERTAQHYVLVVDGDGMTQQALLPMKSTQFKKSKQWNSAMRALKMKDAKGALFVPPRFSHMWNLTTTSEENKNGSWHGWVIEKDSPLEDTNLYEEARLFAGSIKAGQVKVQHVREEDSRDDEIPF
jgi:hypothetical protein